MVKKFIIKRKGRKESYDERKVYASCYAAALNCDFKEKKAEQMAYKVMKAVNKWVSGEIKKNKQISSGDIRKKIISFLGDKQVSFMYKHHLDIC